MKIKVVWDFGDTDLEDVPYDEAIKESGLPPKVAVPEQIVDLIAEEGEEAITDWLSDEYGYTHFGWEEYIDVDWDAFVTCGLRELYRTHGQKDEGA